MREARRAVTRGGYGGWIEGSVTVVEWRRSLREAGVGFAGQRGLLERDSGTAGRQVMDGS
jgi:hypothetical protein